MKASIHHTYNFNVKSNANVKSTFVKEVLKGTGGHGMGVQRVTVKKELNKPGQT